MIIDVNHPDFHRAKIIDQDGNNMAGEGIRSVDTTRGEYTRYQKDSSGRFTDVLELVKVTKVEWCWHTKTITITKDDNG